MQDQRAQVPAPQLARKVAEAVTLSGAAALLAADVHAVQRPRALASRAAPSPARPVVPLLPSLLASLPALQRAWGETGGHV